MLISGTEETVWVIYVACARVLRANHVTPLTVNSIPSSHGVYPILATGIITGLDFMEDWNGMDFSVLRSLILNQWENR